MYNFTPIPSLIGGIIIGISVVIFFYTTGRLAGISGIFANTILNKKNRISNLLFLIGFSKKIFFADTIGEFIDPIFFGSDSFFK